MLLPNPYSELSLRIRVIQRFITTSDSCMNNWAAGAGKSSLEEALKIDPHSSGSRFRLGMCCAPLVRDRASNELAFSEIKKMQESNGPSALPELEAIDICAAGHSKPLTLIGHPSHRSWIIRAVTMALRSHSIRRATVGERRALEKL